MMVSRIPGRPDLVSRLPRSSELQQGGARKSAAVAARLEALVERRDDADGAVRELRGSGIPQAERRDREESARNVAKSTSGRPTTRHAEAARERLADAERRAQALGDAIERDLGELIEVARGEHDKLADYARRTRTEAADQVAEGARMVSTAVDRLERSLGLDAWSASPDGKRWKVPIRAIELRRDVSLAVLLDLLAGLNDVLRSQPVEDEREEAPRVVFGHSAVGERMVQGTIGLR